MFLGLRPSLLAYIWQFFLSVPPEWDSELRCATEIKQKGKMHYIEDQSCIRRPATSAMASGGSAWLISGCWQLIHGVLRTGKLDLCGLILWRSLGTNWSGGQPVELFITRCRCWCTIPQEAMLDFTWEESLGSLSWSNNFPMNATTQGFLKNIYIQRVIVGMHQF